MPFPSGEVLLGKYRIDRLIGAGAFAEVYQATHLKLNAPYALKVLRRDESGLGSSEYGLWVERFQQEAMLGTKLKSPHIVMVHDYEEQDALLVLRMDYLPGGSLADRLQKLKEQERAMSVGEAVRIALETAQGLAALHAMDAVHRDVKPNNILFAADGRALVADLGLAQMPGGASMRSVLSQAAPHPGTPAYMSPEQSHSAEHVTPASDVYALGAVLFEMLTGRLYKNVKGGTGVQALRSETPPWLVNVLNRMLAPDPKMRPWDGNEAVTALESGSEKPKGPIHIPAPRPEEPQKPGRTDKRWLTPVVLGLVAVFGAVVVLARCLAPEPLPAPTPIAAAPTRVSPTSTPRAAETVVSPTSTGPAVTVSPVPTKVLSTQTSPSPAATAVADSPATNSLQPGGSVSGQVAQGAYDDYAFAAQANRPVLVTSERTDGDLCYAVEIANADGEYMRGLINACGGKEEASYTPEKDGKLYLRVRGTSRYGSYAVGMNWVDQGAGAGAGGPEMTIAPGGSVSGQVAQGAYDDYAFAAQANRPVLVTSERTDGDLCYAVEIANADGEYMRGLINACGGKEEASYTPEKDGKLYLRVRGTSRYGSYTAGMSWVDQP